MSPAHYLVRAAHEVGEALQNTHVACAAVFLQCSVKVRKGLGPVGQRSIACRTQAVISARPEKSAGRHFRLPP